MALVTMFNPKEFSPVTTLKYDIGVSDTRIYVNDVSVFAAVPSLATLGTDSTDGEVVQITLIGTDYIDVTRAIVGTAKAHTANTIIARNFSSKDQEVIQENIKKLDDEKLPFPDTLTEMTTVDDTNDLIIVEDVSPTTKVNKKMKLSTLGAWLRTLLFGTLNGVIKVNGSGVVSEAEAGTDFSEADLVFNAQTVSTSDWGTFTAAAGEETLIKDDGFVYRKSISLTGVVAAEMTLYAIASKNKKSCGAIISSDIILYNDGIYIYAKSIPTAEFTFLELRFVKG